MDKILFAFKKLGKKKRGRLDSGWGFDSDSLLLSPPVAIEINERSARHVFFSTKNGRVYSLDEEGKLRWIFDINEKIDEVELMFLDTDSINTISSSPNITDINNDQKKEVVFGSELGVIYCLSGEGKELWRYRTKGATRGGLVACDINGDGKKEIIFGSMDKNLYIISSDGKLLKSFEAKAAIESTPLVIPEKNIIVFGMNNGALQAVDFNAEKLWQFQTKSKIIAEPVFVPEPKKGTGLIVFGSLDHNLYALNIKGDLVWSFRTDGAIFSKAAVADINKDGSPEIVFGSCDNNVYAVSFRGEKIWSYETDFWVVASPLIADIDKDGRLEIIVGSYDHNLYILDAEGEYVLDYVPGLSAFVHQTGSYSDIPMQEPGRHVAKKIWQFNTGGIIVGCAELEKGKVIVNLKKGKVSTIQHTD